jgi:hypothetical protein
VWRCFWWFTQAHIGDRYGTIKYWIRKRLTSLHRHIAYRPQRERAIAAMQILEAKASDPNLKDHHLIEIHLQTRSLITELEYESSLFFQFASFYCSKKFYCNTFIGAIREPSLPGITGLNS